LHPILFQIGSRPVSSYGTCIILGATLAVLIARARAARFGVGAYDQFAVAMLAIAGGIIGAFGLHFALHRAPGFVWYGAAAGGALCGWLYCRVYSVNFPRALDAAAPGIAFGHAVGRIGCLLGGCCYGRDGHPVQLYEAGGLALIGLLTLFTKRPFAVYLLAYPLLRLATESLRGDDVERVLWWGYSTSQILSVIQGALAIAVVMLSRSAVKTIE
jgi:phosphatidylglycerol:prolipoprotein diacylglycerol transferase